MHISRSGCLHRLTRRCLCLSHFPILTNDSGDHRSLLHHPFGSDRLHHCLLGFVSTPSRHQTYLGRARLLFVDFGYPFPHRPKRLGRVSQPQPCHAGLFYGKLVPDPVRTTCDFHVAGWADDLRLPDRDQPASSGLAWLYDGCASRSALHYSRLFYFSSPKRFGDFAAIHFLRDYPFSRESGLVSLAG
jgi:hypothetical protein